MIKTISRAYYYTFAYLESIFTSQSKWSKWSSRKWNRFNRATGGNDVNLFPLNDKYDKLDNFDNCCVGTIWKKNWKISLNIMYENENCKIKEK